MPNLWFFKASERSLAGIPDFIICVSGIFVAMELKRDTKSKASRLQEHTLGLINNAGGFGVIVNPDNWTKMFGVIKTLSEGGKYDRNDLGTN